MFPFLNDWGTVGSLIALAVGTAQQYTDDWEVVLVDDGSTPGNREALEMIVSQLETSKQSAVGSRQQQHTQKKTAYRLPLTANESQIKIVHHDKNRGYGGALRSGFEHCTKKWIFYTDCDAQYDPRELSRLIAAVHGPPSSRSSTLRTSTVSSVEPLRLEELRRGEIGMINGYKMKRNDPWYRTVMGRMYHYTVKTAFRLPIRDTDCDFRLIKRAVFQKVHLFETTGTICVELVKKVDHAGFAIAEVPVHHFWRTSGKSQFFNVPRLYKTATNVGKLWWKLMINHQYT